MLPSVAVSAAAADLATRGGLAFFGIAYVVRKRFLGLWSISWIGGTHLRGPGLMRSIRARMTDANVVASLALFKAVLSAAALRFVPNGRPRLDRRAVGGRLAGVAGGCTVHNRTHAAWAVSDGR
jgi:hypothetical protein